jgi:hypothetical protein
MRLDEAFAELGVPPGTPPDALRRAYLRLVKTRSPESDPEGFQRAREAFELARRVVVRPASVAASVVEPATEPVEPASAAIATASTRVAPVDPYPTEASPKPRVDPPPPSDETAGPPPIASRRDKPPRIEGTRELLRRGAFREAAPLLEADVEAAAREARPLAIEPLAVARTILELIHDRAPASARRISIALESYIEVAGGEARVFGGNATVWILAHELVVVGNAIPLDLRVAMAAAALGGNPKYTLRELDQFESDDPVTATEVAVTLRERAPVLAALYAKVLDRPVPSPPVRRSVPLLFWILGVVMLSAIGRASTCSSPASSEPPSETRARRQAHFELDQKQIEAALDSHDCRRARQLLAAVDPSDDRFTYLRSQVPLCQDGR